MKSVKKILYIIHTFIGGGDANANANANANARAGAGNWDLPLGSSYGAANPAALRFLLLFYISELTTYDNYRHDQGCIKKMARRLIFQFFFLIPKIMDLEYRWIID